MGEVHEMTSIDEEKLEIQLSETFSFEHDVVPKLEDAVEELQEDLSSDSIDKQDATNVKEFLAYTLTHEDKVQILKNTQTKKLYAILHSTMQT